MSSRRSKIPYTLSRVELEGERYRVHLAVENPVFTWETQSAEEQRLVEGRFQHVFDATRLFDKDGQELHPQGGSGGGSADPRPTYRLDFGRRWRDDGVGDTGVPEKLVMEMPVETREVAIPFEFNRLPVPRPRWHQP